LAEILSAEVDKLPAEQLQRFVGWVQAGDVERAAWKKIDDAVRARWSNEPKGEVKHVLGQALLTVLGHQGPANEVLAFLRLQWQKGPENHRTAYANHLFNHLLAQPWSAEIEGEVFRMLDKLSS